MIQRTAANRFNETNMSVPIEHDPDHCPNCNDYMQAIFISGSFIQDGIIQFIYQCAKRSCNQLFIATYYWIAQNKKYRLIKLAPINTLGTKFTEEIANVSDNFIIIYNQAEKAEGEDLCLVAGPGYRKALEFLVKDYMIKLYPAEEASIKKELLGTCINRADDAKVKLCASRAAWLGNDETHYERLWVGKDLQDLKDLIKLTVRWVESSIITARLTEEMPSHP